MYLNCYNECSLQCVKKIKAYDKGTLLNWLTLAFYGISSGKMKKTYLILIFVLFLPAS